MNNDYQNLKVLKQINEALNNNKEERKLSVTKLKEFQEINEVRFSNKLKDYFLNINGTENGDFLARLNSLSNLCKVVDYEYFDDREFLEEEVSKYKNCYILGDIMINSHQWIIKLNNEGKEEPIYEMETDKIIAKNITVFLQVFIENPYSLVN